MPRNFIIRGQGIARMVPRLLILAAVSALAVALPASSAAGFAALALSASGTGFRPGTEIRVPADAAADPASVLIGVACTGRGDCSAGGSYDDADGNGQAMAVTQSRGRWARAVEIRLPANAAGDPYASVDGIACTSAGNCVAVGYYESTAGYDQGFTVAQARGTWRLAR